MLVSALPVSCGFISTRSELVTRLLSDDSSSRQADVFCYFDELSQAASASAPDYGMRVIRLPVPFAASSPALPAPSDLAFSAYMPSRQGPQKLLLAEAYSGFDQDERISKVHQLESLLQFAVQRRRDPELAAVPAELPGRSNRAQRKHVRKLREAIELKYADITCLVGIALLCFSAGSDPRAVQLDRADALVRSQLGRCPGLTRLAAAGRLLVVVLDRTQTPATFNQRAVAAELALSRAEQRRLALALQRQETMLQQLRESLATIIARLSSAA